MAGQLIDDASEPFSAGEGPHGVLLLHGLGGTPAWMRPWGEYLADHGYRISVPRLPGHGTTWQQLGSTRWTDWYACADQALTELTRCCDAVAVAGLSMGGALALRLALERPGEVSAIMLVNPSVANPNKLLFVLPLLQHLVPSIGTAGPMVSGPGVVPLSYERMPLKAVHSMTRLWHDLRPRLPAAACRPGRTGDL